MRITRGRPDVKRKEAWPAGRIDELHFDPASGRLIYLSAVAAKGKPSHMEIYFDQYGQVNGVTAPFEIRLNTKAAQSVLKLKEISYASFQGPR